MANIMPSGAVDTFTGSNGTSVAGTNWTISKADNSGTVTIQSNQARIRTGAASGNRTSIRLNAASRTNQEIDFIWTVPTGTQFPYVFVRTSTNVDTETGYYFSLEPSNMIFGWSTGYSGTDLQTYTHGFTAGQVVHTRIAVFGNSQKARTWLQSNPEPTSTWQIVATDTNQPSAGFIGVTTVSGASGAKDLIIDSFNATDTETPSQAMITFTGSSTPTGALRKTITKNPFTGSSTPTGALSKMRVVVRVFTGSSTPTGLLKKTMIKVFAGSTTPTGLTLKRANKTMAGSTTPTGAFRKAIIKRFTGSSTPTGGLATAHFGRIFGRPGIVVVTRRVIGEVRTRIRRG